MFLNPFERHFITGGVRRGMLRYWDIPRLKKMGGNLTDAKVLEVGCGAGFGVEASYQLLGAKEVHAFDPDPRMVACARQSMTKIGDFQRQPPAKLWHGDAAAIPAVDAEYDAVLCLQVLHHVEQWRSAVAEIARVLRPGGQLLLVETLADLMSHPILGRWMKHPTADRFNRAVLVEALEHCGFCITESRWMGRWMVWLLAERLP